MKKRMGLFLMAMALATTALTTKPVMAQLRLCGPHLACLIGPVCCTNEACRSFCQNLSPGSTPHCSGTYPDGGCCDCQPAEAGI